MEALLLVVGHSQMGQMVMGRDTMKTAHTQLMMRPWRNQMMVVIIIIILMQMTRQQWLWMRTFLSRYFLMRRSLTEMDVTSANS